MSDETNRYNIDWFYQRFQRLEKEFLKILNYIPLHPDLSHPNYQRGSPALMDFCLHVCSEVETIFRCILEWDRFNDQPDIETKRANQNMNIYREIIGKLLNFEEKEVVITNINQLLRPFEEFNSNRNPKWFRKYSKYKHNKLKLIEKWNLLHALKALGAMYILIVNHPDNLHPMILYNADKYKSKVFNQLYIQVFPD